MVALISTTQENNVNRGIGKIDCGIHFQRNTVELSLNPSLRRTATKKCRMEKDAVSISRFMRFNCGIYRVMQKNVLFLREC